MNLTKKYIVIGGKYDCARTGITVKLSPKRLIKIYKVQAAECITYESLKEYQHALWASKFNVAMCKEYRSKAKLYYVLRICPKGDYTNYLKVLKTHRLLEDI